MTITAKHIIDDIKTFEDMVHNPVYSLEQLRVCWRALWEMYTRFVQDNQYKDAEGMVLLDTLIGIGKGIAIRFCELNEFQECIHCLDCVGQGHLF